MRVRCIAFMQYSKTKQNFFYVIKLIFCVMNDENNLDDNASSRNKSAVIGKHVSTFVFQNELSNELPVSIYTILIKKGYKLEHGEKVDTLCGKGSEIGRVFLGAFIKRFAFSVKIKSHNDITSLTFSKHGKGFLGGAIGAAQAKKEYNSIISILKDYHTKTTYE